MAQTCPHKSYTIHREERLRNHLVDEFQARGVLGCAALCLSEEGCVSLNWNGNERRCELNSARRKDYLSDILISSQWAYYERNDGRLFVIQQLPVVYFTKLI